MWEAEAQVAQAGPRSAYVLAAEGWHPGVIGIVASRITERHHRPAVLVACHSDDQSRTELRSRSIPGFDLLAALHAMPAPSTSSATAGTGQCRRPHDLPRAGWISSGRHSSATPSPC